MRSKKEPYRELFCQLILVSTCLSLAIGCGGQSGKSSSSTSGGSAAPAFTPGNKSLLGSKEQASGREEPPRQPEAAVTSRAKGEQQPPSQVRETIGVSAGRKWRSAEGQILAVGEFVDLLDDQVCIETPDGIGKKIPLAQLCPDDQEYVRGQMAGRQAPTVPTPSSDQEVLPSDLVADDEVIVEQIQGSDTHSTGGTELNPAAASAPTEDPRKFVIPFDFVSRFDGGRYGQMVAEMFWKRLQREGGFVLPGSMLEVRDFCASHQIQVTPDTPLEEVGRIVRELFGGHIAIWGSVERAPGATWDVYDLVIKCADFSGDKPQIIFDLMARTNTVSEIPHLYGEQLLDKLYGRQPGGPRPLDPLAEENWAKNPNLVAGGDFEQGTGGVPIGWERGGGQHREPLGRLVKWIPEPGNPSNKIIRFEFSADVGDTYGVMYYSEPFPVEEGATYRFQCRWRSNGPAVKVFIKCYDLFESEYQPASVIAAGKSREPGSYTPSEKQLREVYRSQQNLKGPLNQWNVHTEDFTPRHTKYTPRWGKVMLYAYLGAGVVDFDDVVVKQILPPSPGEKQKELRHSLASPVTVKEMEENIRRGEEARRRRQVSEPK
ncbi:MAG: hypothetical protein RMJ16_02740 [Thermoguttaceae bacterium]|nr:hypothetical protein [Thermoguttaceae bacterium]